MKRLSTCIFIGVLALCSQPAFANGSLVQRCAQNNSTFFSTTTASCNLTGVEEWTGLTSCSPIGTGAPSVVQGLFAGGGSSPHTFTGGTITIGGAANVATVLGNNGNAASSYLVQFVDFPVTSGAPLLLIYGDCDNCNDLWTNIPTGYTARGTQIGDGDSVLMTADATVGAGVLRHHGWIF